MVLTGVGTVIKSNLSLVSPKKKKKKAWGRKKVSKQYVEARKCGKLK